MQFEWDENKSVINKRKHGVTFEEAKTVFYDENAIMFDDPEHPENEERFILIGTSNRTNMLMVCHCYRQSDEMIKIISARKATKNEIKQYQELR